MNHETEVGRRAILIAAKLWPGIRLAEEGSETDRDGTDGDYRGTRVQVKGDVKIASSKNLYVEFYEKTARKPMQRWRHSAVSADASIFVTVGFAVWVTTNDIAEISIGRPLMQINATSIGLLIPMSDIANKTVKRHDLWETRLII